MIERKRGVSGLDGGRGILLIIFANYYRYYIIIGFIIID